MFEHAKNTQQSPWMDQGWSTSPQDFSVVQGKAPSYQPVFGRAPDSLFDEMDQEVITRPRLHARNSRLSGECMIWPYRIGCGSVFVACLFIAFYILLSML